MRFDQYYLDCLSQASYLVGDESSGLAAVIDPRRDVEEYVADAERAGLRIAYVIETHFHADFLSGHLELADRTGAEIVFGQGPPTEFPSRRVSDGERIPLGEVVLEVRATPGHTPESISVVVWERADDPEPYAVLTGDTLFIGDVGRPDLLASMGTTADELASQLYDSLHDKLLTLPDATRVYPAHGAGSACGKNLSTATVSTIGEQRLTNYALQPMPKERFVELVTEGQPSAPPYFVHDAVANRRDHRLLDDSAMGELDLEEALRHQRDGAVLLDVRDAAAFAAGHVEGSINVGLDGRFAEYAGSVVAPHDRIVIVATTSEEVREARVRLGRIGFDHVVGAVTAVEAELALQPDAARQASRLAAVQLRERLDAVDGLLVVDVRSKGELLEGRIPGSVHLPLAELAGRAEELDPDAPIVVHCAGGYRSSIAASWLRAHGHADVSDLVGGFAAWAGVTADA